MTRNSLDGRTDRDNNNISKLSVQQHDITSVIDVKLPKSSKRLLLSHDPGLQFRVHTHVLDSG